MAILRRIFFSHIFFEFLVFVAIIGKISSSSSQSRRKKWKIHWCGLFLAGRKCPGYLARARARARARPSCSTGASGPFDDRRLRSTTFRATLNDFSRARNFGASFVSHVFRRYFGIYGENRSNPNKIFACMQAKKRRLHAVPSCGSDRLKLHFREGSVADISHIRTAYAPREPWDVR